MISFDLRCNKDHVFEAWFQDGASFDEQRKGGKVACPACGSKKVEKALMAPSLGHGTKKVAIEDERKKTVAVLSALEDLRRKVEENCDNVGDKFAEEARKIHYGEVDARDIYGQTTTDEAEALREEGVEFGEIPWIERREN
jgi:hypothetical protein